MILALLLGAAAPQSAVDAERAFAAEAQTGGQWTAFRRYAASDGVMFVPQMVNAQEWLKDRKDPPVSVMWWPGESWISCDGQVAVNTGPWVPGGGKSSGYFTTVWVRQVDGGWKWVLDHGDELPKARPAGDRVIPKRAVCPVQLLPVAAIEKPADAAAFDHQQSPDRTLTWTYTVQKDGARTVNVYLYDGRRAEPVLRNEVSAPRQ